MIDSKAFTRRLGLVVFLLLAGCAAAENKSTQLLNGVTLEGGLVCLDERSTIPQAVEQFYNERDLTTEEGKIDYLLERMRKSNLQFMRNRVEYTGPQASSFLRWKLDRWRNRHHVKINTAQDFIDFITSGSKMSGEPYVVILNEGTRHNLKNVLQNELDALEACLKQYPPHPKKQASEESLPAPKPELPVEAQKTTQSS